MYIVQCTLPGVVIRRNVKQLHITTWRQNQASQPYSHELLMSAREIQNLYKQSHPNQNINPLVNQSKSDKSL